MFGIEGIEAVEFGSCVPGVEPPVDAGLGSIALGDQGLNLRWRAASSESRCLRQQRDSTLNSISAMFNQLPCLGV